jgi:hypothetical protein
MADNPPKINTAHVYYFQLKNFDDPRSFVINPTIAAGDAKVGLDDGSIANPGTLPAVSPAGSAWVKAVFTAAECNGLHIKFSMVDQTSPKQWCDFSVEIPTTV